MSKARTKASEKRNVRIVILLTKDEERHVNRVAKRKDKYVTEIIREAAARVLGARA